MKKLLLIIIVTNSCFFIFSSSISPYGFDIKIYDFLLKEDDKSILPKIDISKESILTNEEEVDIIPEILERVEENILSTEQHREIQGVIEKNTVIETERNEEAQEEKEILEGNKDIKDIEVQEVNKGYDGNEIKEREEENRNTKEEVNIKKSGEKEKKSGFKVKSGLGYSVILDKTWRELVVPILDVRLGCAFPEVMNGAFVFKVETFIDYGLSLLREKSEFTHHTITFKLPLVFNFKVGKRMQLGFCTSLYYSLCLMEYKDTYINKSVYKDDVGGSAFELRYTYKVSSLLDLIIFTELDVPFVKNMYKNVVMGVGLDWSI